MKVYYPRAHRVKRTQMNRSTEIEPMVPEMPTTSVRTDGGRRRATDSEAAGIESEAPLVPDLS
jgi:hypothetical protein